MKALIPIANGVEDIETVTLIDVLRRADIEVTVSSVQKKTITAARGTVITADSHIEEIKNNQFDIIALPGGLPGAEYLRDSKCLDNLIKNQAGSGRLLGAICASPAVVLEPKGILTGINATCHPACSSPLGDRYNGKRVSVTDNIITSQGPETAMEFALKLVELGLGKSKKDEVAKPIITR